jgi:hypothetical protein
MQEQSLGTRMVSHVEAEMQTTYSEALYSEITFGTSRSEATSLPEGCLCAASAVIRA